MTNDKAATPATDDEVRQISWNLRGKPEDGYDLPNIYVFSLIARIEVLQAEIESKNADIMTLEERLEVETCRLSSENAALKTALDELLDWVNGERRTSDDRLAEIESMLPSKGDV